MRRRRSKGTHQRGRQIGACGEERVGSCHSASGPAVWHCILSIHTPGEPAGRGGTRQREHPTNGTEDRWTQNTLGMHRDKALKRHKTTKNKEKKIRVSHCSDSRIGPHIGGRWEGRETRRQGGTGPLLLRRVCGFPFQPQ